MNDVSLRVTDFRRLRELAWAPSGLCLLCGANGAGKSTVLDAFLLLRTLFERGHETALHVVGGRHFRRLDAPDDAPVTFELTVGEVCWRLRFPMASSGLRGHFGEEILRGGEVVARAAMFDDGWYLGGVRHAHDETRCVAKVLWDRGDVAWLHPLVDALTGFRVYEPFALAAIQRQEPVEARDQYLARDGRNLWSVLANWKASPMRFPGQFEWVLRGAREAFPGLIDAVEFDRGLAVIYAAGATDPEFGLPPERMADGLLTGLLLLTAVAGARRGSIIAVDEVESRLHPHAIRAVLAAMRARCEERGLTIIVTTHSPIVMNEFRRDPEQVFVLEPSVEHPSVPVAITELHSAEWIAQAKPGTHYDQLDFASPFSVGS